MPKYVDHDQRRAEIASAVCALINDGGIERVTFRNVAREAGLSVGVVSHFFADKDALFAHTLRQVSDRGLTVLTGLPIASRRDVVDLIVQALPVDDAALHDARVWVSLWARSIDRPEFARAMIACDNEWRDAFAEALTRAADAGVLPARARDRATVERLRVVIDGLSFRTVLEPGAWPADRLRVEAAAFVDDLVETQ